MERIEQEYGYYTIDELGRFHWEWEEPAIAINDHLERDDQSREYIEVSWYRAWYDHWKLIKSIRNSWEEFISNE